MYQTIWQIHSWWWNSYLALTSFSASFWQWQRVKTKAKRVMRMRQEPEMTIQTGRDSSEGHSSQFLAPKPTNEMPGRRWIDASTPPFYLLPVAKVGRKSRWWTWTATAFLLLKPPLLLRNEAVEFKASSVARLLETRRSNTSNAASRRYVCVSLRACLYSVTHSPVTLFARSRTVWARLCLHCLLCGSQKMTTSQRREIRRERTNERRRSNEKRQLNEHKWYDCKNSTT